MVTFYLDHNISYRILPYLHSAGHQTVATRETGMNRADDDAQVFFAWQNGWITITHNRQDFLLVHHTLRRWGDLWHITDIHAGILAFPDSLAIREQARLLDVFIASDFPIANTFYEWRSIGSWVQR
jgi:predicted nuclease of predicted toxin-antitoxin system